MKLQHKLFTICLLSSALLGAQVKTTVHYVDLNEIVEGQPVKEYNEKASKENGKRITIYPEIEFQTIEGVGGAFNEIGGEALMSLPKNEQKEVMKNLFSEAGAAFTFCRTAVGASDFGIDAYSYSEKKNDFEMKHFSVKREKESVLPYIQMAIQYNSDLKVFASPWSPPGWMKMSGLMDRGVEFPEKNHLKYDEKIYEAYAEYFVNYIQTYAENGIEISRLIVQNEPDVHTKYPSCVMPPEQMAEFAGKYLRPAVQYHRLNTEVWAGTFRTAQQLDAVKFVADEEMRSTVDGIGIQYTKPRFIHDMLSICPDIKFMHTEGNCYNGANSVEQASKRLEEVASYINHGCPNYCYWNMILNETGKSGWDWKQNSLINIDRQAQKVTYNPDFAVISLLSKFMQPGVVRIAGFSRSTLISVKDGNKVHMIVQNDSDKPETYEIWTEEEKTCSVEVPSASVSVITMKIK